MRASVLTFIGRWEKKWHDLLGHIYARPTQISLHDRIDTLPMVVWLYPWKIMEVLIKF